MIIANFFLQNYCNKINAFHLNKCTYRWRSVIPGENQKLTLVKTDLGHFHIKVKVTDLFLCSFRHYRQSPIDFDAIRALLFGIERVFQCLKIAARSQADSEIPLNAFYVSKHKIIQIL